MIIQHEFDIVQVFLFSRLMGLVIHWRLQAGGPFYPLFTGRRDSTASFYAEAMAEIPRPDDNIRQTLHLFRLRGFNERETVSLLGTDQLLVLSSSLIQLAESLN